MAGHHGRRHRRPRRVAVVTKRQWVAGALGWAAGAILLLLLDTQSPLWEWIDDKIDAHNAGKLDWTRRKFRRNKFERFTDERDDQ